MLLIVEHVFLILFFSLDLWQSSGESMKLENCHKHPLILIAGHVDRD